MSNGRNHRLALAAFLVTLLSTAAWSAPSPERVDRDAEEDAITEWVVYPKTAGLSAEHASLVTRFMATTIAQRYPELEFKGYRPAGGMRFGIRDGAVVRDTQALALALDRLPGARGAMPLPSGTAMLKARMRQLARGGPESRASGLIVRYRAGSQKSMRGSVTLGAAELRELSDIVGEEIVGSRPMAGGSLVLDFAADIDIHSAALASSRLEMHPDVDFVSPNGYASAAIASTDPFYSKQWNLTDLVSGINVQPAWDITIGHPAVVIAVVDTGIIPHPEFNGRILPGYDFITLPSNAGDGNGRDPDPTDNGTFRPAGYCGAGDLGANSVWHGTHVAGILGASGNNGIGIAGVSWRSSILPVRVLGKCGGSDSDILDGLYWAAGLPVTGVPNNPNPAWVINMSLGGPGNCLIDKVAYQVAIFEALGNGASVVVAAGNEGESALTRVPASCIGTIKVAAIGPNGDRTSYSNLSQAIEIAAPGGNFALGSEAGIPSTYATGTQADVGSFAYAYLQGTSMAAPHVAGVASLVLAAQPSLTVAQVREVIRASSFPFPANSFCATSKACGLGIVDAGEAVGLALQIVQPFNFSDMWWVPDESGWGLNLQHQGDIMFGTWFTYRSDGQPTWFFMSNLQRINQDYFVGDIHQATGVPWFNQIPGNPALETATKVGTALVTFFGLGINKNPNLDFDSAIFYYEIGDVKGTKPIQRYFFSHPTVCGFTTASRASSTNYQDLWWKHDESGWGINVTHQGDTLFTTWFTYAAGNTDFWFYSDLAKTGNRTYSGQIYKTTGVPYDQIQFQQAVKSNTSVGQLTLTFTDGEHGRMDYVIQGQAGTKPIERFLFSTPLSVCQPTP